MELMATELATILESEVCGQLTRSLNRKLKICLDSRKCESGQIFWAIAGENFDAHNFVEQAMERGALMAVVDEKWAAKNGKTVQAYIPVRNTRTALRKLAAEYGSRFNIPRIGITGSNGKTSTKEMIYQVMSTRKKGIATEGNFNNEIGVPLTMFRINHSHEFAVIEMGTNSPGEIKRLSQTGLPTTAVITNIGHSHLEKLKTLDAVFAEKTDITAGLKKGGTLIVNADDPFLSRLRSTTRYKLVTFGIRRGQIKPTDLEWDENGCAKFRIGRTRFALKVPGVHSLYNALAAFAVGVHHKIPKNEISRGLSQYRGSSMRMEIREVAGVNMIVDCYNANPGSVRAGLHTIGNMQAAGKKVAVLGDMLELGEHSKELHHEVGTSFQHLDVDLLLTIGDEGEHIGRGAISAGMSEDKWMHFKSSEELAMCMHENLMPGDLCLVKASRGMKLEEVVNQYAQMSGVGGK